MYTLVEYKTSQNLELMKPSVHQSFDAEIFTRVEVYPDASEVQIWAQLN